MLIKGGWESWVSDREEHQIGLRKNATPSELDELSRADTRILQQIWDEFGGQDGWALRTFTHENCPEWQNPGGSSIPITYEQIFLALEHSEDESRELAERIESQRAVERLLQAG